MPGNLPNIKTYSCEKDFLTLVDLKTCYLACPELHCGGIWCVPYMMTSKVFCKIPIIRLLGVLDCKIQPKSFSVGGVSVKHTSLIYFGGKKKTHPEIFCHKS